MLSSALLMTYYIMHSLQMKRGEKANGGGVKENSKGDRMLKRVDQNRKLFSKRRVLQNFTNNFKWETYF